MGKCRRAASACNYCHDINTAENKKILKTHELSGLNENELKVLLLQNDPFLLPDVCQFYNQGKDTCTQQNNCNKLHICRHFLRGECRFLQCKRSHSLLNAHELSILKTGGIDFNTALNFQTICDHKHVEFNEELKKAKISFLFIQPSLAGPRSSARGQNQHQQPTGGENSDEDKKDDSSAKDSKDNKIDKCDEICLFYVWKYCKNKDKCKQVHYHLPYRWQVYNGITWNDLSMMEEIEKAYCDPKNSRIADKNINFEMMTCGTSSLRRLSTPSSVTKPTFALTTQWIWYWKDDRGQWSEYGKQGEGGEMTSPASDSLENLYLADQDATIPFQAGWHHYEINFKEMTQTNVHFGAKRKVCRRPKFVSSEDVEKIKKGQRDSSIPNQTCPVHWDQSALPELGYKAVELTSTSSEYKLIQKMFEKTMKRHSVHRISRIQNPSLWKVFQWQKEQMKKENGGKEVEERLLFHGAKISFLEVICNQNFDWRICGSNGTTYGKAVMFVARVLVGDFVEGNASYVRPPSKSASMLRFYDSCVDNKLNPSIFVVFEKKQIYPEYLIEYKEAEKKCIVS
ncbi:PREDICTED: LOW QUALITY PROTEIN: poly [ADP-ribose] polymerase 12-like [Tinamus guttatus]|uniref:LOW QUALITY PROTEIN: poly [ADP-ribose] polymerase 12-like n=1 Tax=Tinamus guttatus TaxID=94827 RepID=UPI00052E80BB|nr:PREDICTED: LOW QUALITY PROTEIN: poly [ADP-ribose] polymerase 12-like [Tinamus guttatus]